MAPDERSRTFLEMLDELNARHLIGVEDVREVWLIRHADAYVGLEALGDGPLDPPLSPQGRDQARRLAARLSAVRLDAVWSSPLRRARETAGVVARDHGLDVQLEDGLREVRTPWDDGRPYVPQEPGTYPFPEPEAEVVERMRSAIWRVVGGLHGRQPLSDPPRAAVVSHNAAIAIYVSNVLGLGWGQLRVLPQFTSVTVLAVKGERVVVQSIADATHLAAEPA
jgi:probable phosphoglycerate mutase